MAYIEDLKADVSVAPVFKLSDLIKLYSTWLHQL